jgi:S-adenosylmethionine hydrolase
LRAADGRLLVGPDNGLLLPAAERAGGVVQAVEISASPWRLEPVSATFHGRDVFAPVAARLARGDELAEAGAPLAVDELVRLERPVADAGDGVLVATATGIDGFGNVMLGADGDDLLKAGLRIGEPVAVRTGARRIRGGVARTFADVRAGDLLVYEDAGGTLAVAVNGGDAAALLGVRAGDELRVERP